LRGFINVSQDVRAVLRGAHCWQRAAERVNSHAVPGDWSVLLGIEGFVLFKKIWISNAVLN
jgi:hypothetical protein